MFELKEVNEYKDYKSPQKAQEAAAVQWQPKRKTEKESKKLQTGSKETLQNR